MISLVMEELRKHLDQLFPTFLNPPATEYEIQLIEEQMNIKFSSDLRQLYLTHNGENEMGPGLFFGLPFLSLNDLLQEWKIWSELEEEYAFEGDSFSIPTGYIKERYINRYWIPISKDFGGNNLGIDLDPDNGGKIGQLINFGRDEEVKFVIANQLNDLLQFIIETIEEGNYTIHRDEDYTYWSYGRNKNIHFMDVLHSLDLPVLNPIKSSFTKEDVINWFEQLDTKWKHLVQKKASNPDAFVKKKKLYLIGEDISDITPLSICTEVREMILSGNQINDIRSLVNMTSLKKLYLVNNPVSEIEAIASLKNLQQLNINKTEISDLMQIAKAPMLKELEMLDTNIEDYSALQQCKSLESLTISVHSLKQLEAISNMCSLKELHIHNMKNISEEEIQLLKRLKNLQLIEFENSYLTSLNCLSTCNSLNEIVLNHTILKDGSDIGDLKGLKKLKLNDSTIHNLEVIAQSPSLKIFQGSFQQFNILKDLFSRKIDFSTISGEMTEAESEVWHQYLDSNE
ncbi:SMI1/KNR4 family protein [Heyndrickxia sporothermodurans]